MKRSDGLAVVLALVAGLSCAGRRSHVLLLPGTVVKPAPAASVVATVEDSLTGVVTDGTTGRPLQSAQVHVAGTSVGVLTDSQGRFSLPRDGEGVELRVDLIGYASRAIYVPRDVAGARFEIPMATTSVCLGPPPIIPPPPPTPYEYWFVLEPTVLGSSIPFAGELEVTAELVGAPNPDPIRERSDAPVAIEVPGPGYYQFRVEARGHHPWSGGEYSIGDTCEVIDVRRVRIELVPREGH